MSDYTPNLFTDVKAKVSLEQASDFLGLKMRRSSNQFRSSCPACERGDERSLAITPAKGFYCHAAGKGGDVIAFVAHIRGIGQREAAQELAEHFGIATRQEAAPKPHPAKQLEPVRPMKAASASTDFDPDAFASKLQYTPEVEALGLSEDDATRIGVGWHPLRKAIYLGFRNPDGSWSGWMKFADGELIMPPQWIATNVVPLKRRAQW